MDLKSKLDSHRRESISLWQQWWYEADTDLRMAIGDQTVYNDLYGSSNPLLIRKRQMLYYNKIRRILNMIEGYQRRNRLTTIITPRENSDQETADILSDCMMWAMAQDNVYHTISDTFGAALTVGLNLLSVWMDYREDMENGDIRCDRVPHSSVLMDPYWTKADLSDCNWIWTRKMLSSEQVKSLMPSQAKEIDRLKTKQFNKDGNFAFLPQNFGPNQMDLMALDEYWESTTKKTKMLLNRATGEMVPFKGDEEKLAFYQRYAPIELIKVDVPTVKLNILVNGEPIYEEIAPDGLNRFPYVPVYCYIQPEVINYSWRIQGIVRNIRDVQRELNHRRNVMSDILDSQVNSGLIVKENALVNPEDAFLTGQGRVLFTKETSQVGDVNVIPPPQLPPSLFELANTMEKEIMEISGATEELFGSSNEEIAGILGALRQGAGLTSLQKVFDQLNLSQQILGQIYLELIQNNWSAEKMQRITNRPVTDQVKNRMFAKYDAVVQEGLLTATQQQMQFAQMLQLQQMGIPIPADQMIKSSTLQNKTELLESIEQQEKAQAQAQEAQMQMQAQQNEAVVESLKARSIKDVANAQERHTRSVANMGLEDERIAKSIEDRSDAILNRAKALKELQSLDDERLLALLEIYNRLNAMNEVQEQRIKEQDVVISEGVGDKAQEDFLPQNQFAPEQQMLPGMQSMLEQQLAQPGGMP